MKIGNTVRELRKGKKLTIKKIASVSGIAPSLISQIENDKANPSLSTLISIAEALEVPIMAFFGEEDKADDLVVRAKDRTMITERLNAQFFSLTNDILGNFEFLYCVYQKDGQSDTDIYTHKGAEALFLLKGRLEVEVDGTRYILDEGDSIAFSSERPHLTRNINDGESIAVTVNAPPTY